jgi:thioredoxin 1
MVVLSLQAHVTVLFILHSWVRWYLDYLKKKLMQTRTKSFNEMLQDERPVLVDFSAEWCGPCKMMAPILKEVKKEMGDNVTILKIDVDNNNHLAAQYSVQAVPTLMIFKGGQIKWRHSGVMPAAQLQNILQQFL